MNRYTRLVAAVRAVVVFALAIAMVVPASAQSPVIPLSGTVIDAASGLPLATATVTATGPADSTVSADRDGRFSFASIAPGLYTLVARAEGYQPAQSETVTLVDDTTANVTLSLQRVAGSTNLRTIGTTSVRATASLQKASVLYQQVNAEAVTEQGLYRLGDALRELPGVVNGASGDTAAPADDLYLNFRGIGNLETLTLLDGHPVGYGLRNPYNLDISPAPLFRNVQAVYGSGADQFYPLNSIGGIFDFQTIDPTRTPRASITQQIGTFGQASSIFTTTGTIDKIGYAIALGGQGTNGPVNHRHDLFAYSAAQDPGATDAFRNNGFYQVDTATTTHTLLGKLTFPIAKNTTGLISALTESFYDDKTGNGDLDFLPYDQALASAIATASAPNSYAVAGGPQMSIADAGGNITCPQGYAPLTNGNGVPSGTYTQNTIGLVQNGVRTACVTPQQYAANSSGLNGAGPAFQTFNLQDYHAKITQTNGNQETYIDGYVDNYTHHYDRDQQLPFIAAPGDNPYSYYEGVVNSGLTLATSFTSPANTLGFGFSYNNANYTDYSSPGPIVITASSKSDFAGFVRDAYKVPSIPLTLYANVFVKNAGETNTSFVDPRVAAVYTLKNDVFRASAGVSSTQPYLAAISAPFTQSSTGAFAGNVTNAPGGSCSTATNSPIAIGSGGGGSFLRPERGIDIEASYGHRFGRDSNVQATFYTTNVFDKIYSATSPLSITGTGFINPSYLAQVQAVVRGICGQTFDTNTGLGISAPVNLGHVRAQGLEVSGRQRLIRRVALDYDYGIDAVQLVSAPVSLLVRQSTLIQGSQLPNVPLHQYNLGLNYEFVRNANVRIAYHHISDNNTKNLGPYGFADFVIAGPVGPGRLGIAVNNLFGSQAFYQGLENIGVPLATNTYAAGQPRAQERFGLPNRQVDLTYTLSTK